MSRMLRDRIRARKVDLRGIPSDHAQKRANDVFRKICDTACEYEPSGEPAADVVEAAIYKHSTAMAGLMGSLDAAVDGGLSENPEVREGAQERSLKAFQSFRRDVADYLKQQIIEMRAERARDAPDR